MHEHRQPRRQATDDSLQPQTFKISGRHCDSPYHTSQKLISARVPHGPAIKFSSVQPTAQKTPRTASSTCLNKRAPLLKRSTRRCSVCSAALSHGGGNRGPTGAGVVCPAVNAGICRRGAAGGGFMPAGYLAVPAPTHGDTPAGDGKSHDAPGCRQPKPAARGPRMAAAAPAPRCIYWCGGGRPARAAARRAESTHHQCRRYGAACNFSQRGPQPLRPVIQVDRVKSRSGDCVLQTLDK